MKKSESGYRNTLRANHKFCYLIFLRISDCLNEITEAYSVEKTRSAVLRIGELVTVRNQRGPHLYITNLIRYKLEAFANRIIQIANWNISWTYQIFLEVGTVRPVKKKIEFTLYFPHKIYIYDFFSESGL